MTIRPLLYDDLNNLLDLIKIHEKPSRLEEYIDFYYRLEKSKNGDLLNEYLEVNNNYVFDIKKDAKSPYSNIMKRFKNLGSISSITVKSEESTQTPHNDYSQGRCDFKISVYLNDPELQEKKPAQYMMLVAWPESENPKLKDISANYTLLVKDFKIMKDF